MGRKKQFTDSPGYCVSTIGLDDLQIRQYVKNQEKLERGKIRQLNLPDFEEPWHLYGNFLTLPMAVCI